MLGAVAHGRWKIGGEGFAVGDVSGGRARNAARSCGFVSGSREERVDCNRASGLSGLEVTFARVPSE